MARMLLMTQLGRGIAGMYDPTSLTGYSSSSLGQGIGGALEGIMALRKQAQERSFREEQQRSRLAHQQLMEKQSAERLAISGRGEQRKVLQGKALLDKASEIAQRPITSEYEAQRVISQSVGQEFDEPTYQEWRATMGDQPGLYRLAEGAAEGEFLPLPPGTGFFEDESPLIKVIRDPSTGAVSAVPVGKDIGGAVELSPGRSEAEVKGLKPTLSEWEALVDRRVDDLVASERGTDVSKWRGREYLRPAGTGFDETKAREEARARVISELKAQGVEPPIDEGADALPDEELPVVITGLMRRFPIKEYEELENWVRQQQQVGKSVADITELLELAITQRGL
jgi:hypothetical protein